MTGAWSSIIKLRPVSQISEHQSTERTAAREAAKVKPRIETALDDLAGEVDLDEVQDAFASGSPPHVSLESPALREALAAIFIVGVAAGRANAVRHLPRRLERIGDTAVMLSPVSARGAQWALTEGSKLVVSVDDATRTAIRETITRSIAEGLHPRTAAKELQTIVGLTPRDAKAVANARANMLETGLSAGRIDETISEMRDRLIAQRADNIARTETFKAVNEGRQDLWVELAGQGEVNAQTVIKQWVTSRDERVDEDCDILDGEEVGVLDDFSAGVSGPPLHPSCRCTVLIRGGE